MTCSKTCLALIAEGTEELELIGAVDIIRRAGITTTIAGVDGREPVRCRTDTVIVPDISLSEVIHSDYDVVLVPGGGAGVRRMIQSSFVKDILTRQDKSGRIIAAICAGPTVLKAFSLAHNKTVTSYPSSKDEMLSDGNYKYSEDKVVVDGNIITSRGPGTVIEFGLAIVQNVLGDEVRDKVAKGLIYN